MDEFAGWYEELSDGHRESVIHSVGLLEQMGVHLPSPHSSDLKGAPHALRELRVKAQELRFASLTRSTLSATQCSFSVG
jgi:hypothetical protein